MTTLWIAAGVIGGALLIAAWCTGRPVRTLATSAMQGLCALAAVNIVSIWSGVTLGVTTFSAVVCAALGIPGAATLLIMQVLL
ncbi:MAG: pro-sigmaK processing inhibitor BofA family protein [Clostridia bacterium]|nr:pro-sigmaK processing inhibitor BofA family protein [Clostridia bacterium]